MARVRAERWNATLGIIERRFSSGRWDDIDVLLLLNLARVAVRSKSADVYFHKYIELRERRESLLREKTANEHTAPAK